MSAKMAAMLSSLPWSDATVQSLLWTVVILILWLTLSLVVRRLAGKRMEDTARRYSLRKALNYTLGFVFVLVLVMVWTRFGTGLAAYLGILSAGLAIALQDPLANLAGWMFILARRPFVVGDRIEIGEHRGDVIDVRLFQFSLIEIGNWVDADQSTGRIIHVPNGAVFRRPLANYTLGFNFIWDEIPVTITFESNWTKAKEILSAVASRHSAIQSEQAAAQVRDAARRYLIQYHHLTPIVWTSVADIGVTLTLRYLVEPRKRRSTANDIWESILAAFSEVDDIDFAYPTQRFYSHWREGKPGAGAASEGDAPEPVGDG